MELIISDAAGKELGFLTEGLNIDMDIGQDNNFEFSMNLSSWDAGNLNYNYQIFAPGTEYGGLIEDIETRTKTNMILIRGHTWRGLMTQKIIEPPPGQSHLFLSGELNQLLNQLIGHRFGILFQASTVDTGIRLTNYQVSRYSTLLEGIKNMLSSVGYRIELIYKRVGPYEPGYVEVSSVPIINYSDKIEYSQDRRINFISRDYRGGINHLICAGEGEGEGRAIVNLYVDSHGDIGDIQYYTGLQERTALYAYTSQDDINQLKMDGAKRLREIMNYKQFEMSVEDVGLEIGDIVSGRDRVTGMLIQKPVIQKILKINGNKKTTEYKLKGED